MKKDKTTPRLSRRERQIMDVVFERGETSARDIHGALADAPSYSSVRALLAILVDKGHLTFRQSGARYLYSPAMALEEAREGALQRVLKTFFRGSASDAVTALVGDDAENLSDDELDELAQMIERARARRE